MTFVHPLLLGGLLLVGVPLLIHLIMRQKPRPMPFPAFRFLLQKHRTNQTRLRLRHLLLLLLRMAVIAALCLALVRPAVTGGVLPPIGGDRPVNAVLLVDTSYSMEYAVGGRTRLDEAKRRAGELVEELPDGSKVAVLDSAEVGGEWLMSPALARERLATLRLRHANAALPRQIEQAYRLFAEEDRSLENPTEARPKVLYIFSDRTHGCWDETAAKAMTQPQGVSAVFVDLGTEDPADLAIVEVKAEPPTVRPGEMVKINVTVQATGADYNTTLVCSIDGEVPGEPRELKLEAGRAQVVTFERRAAGPARAGEAQTGLAEGLHQVEVRLANSDALPFDNVGYATFRVLEGRRVLVLADDRAVADDWAAMLAEYGFRPDVRLPLEAKADLRLDDYAAVCLFNVARPDAALWASLQQYVKDGHGLAVILGGGKAEPVPAAYNDDRAAVELLPARLERVQPVTAENDRFWAEFQGDGQLLARHSLLAHFRRWKAEGVDFFTEEGKPRASKFWKVTPIEGQADVLTHYSDKGASPALLERNVGAGRVLMLTTPVGPEFKDWNNYVSLSSFGFVLSNMMVRYLVGDEQEPTFNYITGQAVPVPLPAKPFLPTYTLAGPGVVGSDATLTRQPEQRELRIVNATAPGNFTVLAMDGGARRLAAFSLNPRPDECRLDRVPVEPVEALLGPGSVLAIGRTVSLRDRLQERWTQPLELAPWLLIALLLFLAIESLLANRFYRQRAPGEPELSRERPASAPEQALAERSQLNEEVAP